MNLHEDIARELDGVKKLFDYWEADCHNKRQQALRALEFPNLDMALVAFNFHGQRQLSCNRHIQDFYFATRRCTASSFKSSEASGYTSESVCTRCFCPIPRHSSFFIDTAKQSAEADKLCNQCLTLVMRRALGYDDDLIMKEATRILDSAWLPTIKPALADMLLERRTFFSD